MTASAGPVLRRLFELFGEQIAFVTLYVREAHPGERLPQPETFEKKMQHARSYEVRDEIPWPVAVDSLAGDLHRALDAKPNATYLMNVQGNVAFRTLWSNDEPTMRQAVEAMAERPQAQIGERHAMVAPMLKGLGLMEEILQPAGAQAMQDIWGAAPPMYVLGRLAARFRSLGPLGRGLAAMGTSTLGLALVIGGFYWMMRHQSFLSYESDPPSDHASAARAGERWSSN